MKTTYPLTIENCVGEKLVFKELLEEPDGDRLLVENFVAPGCGPVMHTHLQQDESLTVVKGKIGYQVQGEPARYAGEGATILFKRGVPHRFWNEGTETLNCEGWIKPANTVVFFLSSVYAAQNKTGTSRPETFDSAYLFTHYSTEFDLPEIPFFVKKIVIPATYFIGKLLGKYRHFKTAPDAVQLK